jgi:hypothetical protein
MATLAAGSFDGERPATEERFALTFAIVMALTVVAGFSTQLAMGRSSFGSPLRVHVHAIAFMGWVALFVTQTWLATRGPLALHRKLGWIAASWIVLMVGAALAVIVAIARNGTVPFFFRPQVFLIGDPLTLVGFIGLTWAAIAMRKQTDWHARLHICGMAALMGPAFGRLLPMPLMTPWSLEIATAAGAVFPIAGMIRDRRRTGRVHPAWKFGVATIAGMILLTDVVGYSPIGAAIYRAVTAGTPGAAIDPLAFAAPPASGPVTGR